MNINIDGVNLYYELYGQAKPIILLHGNSETHEIFDKLIDKLKENYKVYAIDSRCHGKSEDTLVISYKLMRDDIIEFIEKLEINKPILYGFSDGGIVGILIAIEEPNLLSKLIVSGANINPKGVKDYIYVLAKLYCIFKKDKLIKMMLKEPVIKLEELNKIKTPTVVLAGRKDLIKQKHTKLIADNIPNCTLEIIEKENHGSYIVHSEKIYEILKKYI